MGCEGRGVYVTRPIPEAGLKLLRASCDVEVKPKDELVPREELLEKVKGRDAILCLLTEPIDEEVIIAAGSDLKVIANYAVGYDNVDVDAATKHGIYVTNTPGVLTETTADMAWALLFSIARRIVEADRFTRAGKYKGWSATMLLGGDVYGKTLGVVGAGRIGAAVAKRSVGFNMKVLYSDMRPNEEMEKKIGAKRVDVETLLKESDFVSIHVPLMPETEHLINKHSLQLMKPTAYLINNSRGPVIDEAALVDALRNKIIAGAGLDVFEKEPELSPGLAELDNVIITPHTSSGSVETRDKMSIMAATNVLAVLDGKTPPPNAVNKP